MLPLGNTTTLDEGLGGRGDFTVTPTAVAPVAETLVEVHVVLVNE